MITLAGVQGHSLTASSDLFDKPAGGSDVRRSLAAFNLRFLELKGKVVA